MWGAASQPVFADRTAWRAVIDDAAAAGEADEATESWGRGHLFGIVPMSGGRLGQRPADQRLRRVLTGVVLLLDGRSARTTAQ